VSEKIYREKSHQEKFQSIKNIIISGFYHIPYNSQEVMQPYISRKV